MLSMLAPVSNFNWKDLTEILSFYTQFQHHTSRFPTLKNKNMAEAQNCELGVTSKVINLGSRNSER